MSISFKNRQRILRFFQITNSRPVILGGMITAAVMGITAAVYGWKVTSFLCLVSAAVDFLRMQWLKNRGLWR